MPDSKNAADAGVAVNPPRTPDRYAEHGLPVSVPTDASVQSESEPPAKSATPKKES